MNRKAKNMRIVLAPMDSDVAAENDTLETALIRQDELALLKGKVEELEEEYRIPLVLRFADNLRYKDIAVLLDISDAAVRKRVERALDLLTAAFRKEGLLDV
jgi:RNA polymerase sigma-70 factor (ECF subfamily)